MQADLFAEPSPAIQRARDISQAISKAAYASINVLEPTIKPDCREKSKSWTTIRSAGLWFSGYVPNPIIDSESKETIVQYVVENGHQIGA